MRRTVLLAIGASIVLGGGIAAVRMEPIEAGRPAAPIVFVCRNGVAMSVWSAAYFNRLAAQRGIAERAVARASMPSFTAVPWSMRTGLALDGFRLAGFHPQVIDAQDTNAATLVIAIDTELPADAKRDTRRTEVWRGFPPMRERYFPSRAALKERVEGLVERLASGG